MHNPLYCLAMGLVCLARPSSFCLFYTKFWFRNSEQSSVWFILCISKAVQQSVLLAHTTDAIFALAAAAMSVFVVKKIESSAGRTNWSLLCFSLIALTAKSQPKLWQAHGAARMFKKQPQTQEKVTTSWYTEFFCLFSNIISEWEQNNISEGGTYSVSQNCCILIKPQHCSSQNKPREMQPLFQGSDPGFWRVSHLLVTMMTSSEMLAISLIVR